MDIDIDINTHTQSLESYATLHNPVDCRCPQARPSIGFPKKEYWKGLPFPSPGDVPNAGIEPMSLVSSALRAGSLPTEPPGKPIYIRVCVCVCVCVYTSMIREVRVHLDFKFWK